MMLLRPRAKILFFACDLAWETFCVSVLFGYAHFPVHDLEIATIMHIVRFEHGTNIEIELVQKMHATM